MSYITRRKILIAGYCLIVAGSIMSLNGSRDSRLFARSACVDNQISNKKFISATVFNVVGNTINAVDPRSKQPVVIKVSPKFVLWKGTRSNNLSPLIQGDLIFATLELQPDGSFQATEIYANLFNRYGRILNLKGSNFTLFVAKSGVHPERAINIIVEPNTIIHLDGKKGTGGNGTISNLESGRFAQVIGVELPDSHVQATRIYIYIY